MEKMQWFKFSISEWKMGKIQKCTPEAKSSFMELCCLYWINETKLSIEDAIIECDEDNYKNLLSKKVIKEIGGFIKIYFLDEQFENALEKSVKARESVEKRWAKRNTIVLGTNNDSNTTVLQPNYDSNTEEKRREEKRKEIIYSFDEFWKLYGKSSDKKSCLAKFEKLTNEELEKIKINLPNYILSTPDIKYRKNPLTWLNRKCWEDEIEISTSNLKNGKFLSYAESIGNPKPNLSYEELMDLETQNKLSDGE